MPRDLGPVVAPAHTVLVLQECQEGVIGSRSALPEIADVAQRTIVPNLVRLVHAARAAGVRVIHATASHQPDYFGANRNARLFAGTRKSPVQLVHGDPATAPLAQLEIEGTDDIVLPRQHGLSPFEGTELDSLLRNEGIRTVVLAGVSLNVAILNVTFDAVNKAYEVVIARDAVSGTPAEYGEQVLQHTLGYIATITTTDDVVGAWASSSG